MKLILIKSPILFTSILFFVFSFSILAESLNLPVDTDGWTVFTPSADSRIMYVSTTGNDATGLIYNQGSVGSDPFEPNGSIRPFKTYAAAYAHTRDGYADWILIRRGDIFTNETIGDQIRDGRNSSEPFLIAAYGGSGLSPVFKTGTESALIRTNTGIDWFAISGISFYAHTRDPDGINYTGPEGSAGIHQYVSPGNESQGVLIEGCKFRFYTNNTLNNYGNGMDIIFNRTVILDNYPEDHSHSQGLWAKSAKITIKESIFDHNGWYRQSDDIDPLNPEAEEATKFNHNIYLDNLTDSVIRDSLFLRASSMGNKIAIDLPDSSYNLVIENNLYVDGEIGIAMAEHYDYDYLINDISISDNVFTNIGRSRPTGRTLAWTISLGNMSNATISNNFLIHQPEDVLTNCSAFSTDGELHDINIINNIVYNMRFADGLKISNKDKKPNSNLLFSGNKIQLPEDAHYLINTSYDPSGIWTIKDNIYFSDRDEPYQFRMDGESRSYTQWLNDTGDTSSFTEYTFPDSTRSIELYQASIGENPSIDAFIESCRAQDRYDWDTRYSLAEVNSWLKAGFSIPVVKPENNRPFKPINLKIK